MNLISIFRGIFSRLNGSGENRPPPVSQPKQRGAGSSPSGGKAPSRRPGRFATIPKNLPQPADIQTKKRRAEINKLIVGRKFSGEINVVNGEEAQIRAEGFPHPVFCPASCWNSKGGAMRQGASVEFSMRLRKLETGGCRYEAVQAVIEKPAPEKGHGRQNQNSRQKPASVVVEEASLSADVHLELFAKLLPRLIRSARTGKPHPYLPQIFEQARAAGLDWPDICGKIPPRPVANKLEQLQALCAGTVFNPECEKFNSKVADSIGELIETIEEPYRAILSPIASAARALANGDVSSRRAVTRSAGPRPKKSRTVRKKPGAAKSSAAKPLPVEKAAREPLFRGNVSTRFVDERRPCATIYMDETWPKADKNLGVLAGIVWLGAGPDPSLLPVPKQHLRGSESSYEFLRALSGCPHAIPFLFEFQPDGGIDPRRAYEQMVHESLLILLGWLLPERMPSAPGPVPLRVVCEAIDRDHGDGANQTERFNGVLLQAGRRDPSRYARWQFEELCWVKKSLDSPENLSPGEISRQGYLAYGDLLAYMAHQETSSKARALAAEAGFKDFPNRIRLAPSLANTLEMCHEVGLIHPGLFIDQFTPNMEEPLFIGVTNALRTRWSKNTGAKAALLQEISERYRSRLRDPRQLAREMQLVERVAGPISDLDESAPRRIRLLALGLKLQRANQFGGSLETGRLEAAYQDLRQRSLENGDADLVAHVDLHLAVRAADRFEPEQALLIVEDLLSEGPRLSLLSKAKARSARGQYLSILGKRDEAEVEFLAALDLFDQAHILEEERRAEREQTSIYRAFNSIEAGSPEAGKLVLDLVGDRHFPCSRETQHRHHLWLRYLDSEESLADERVTYISHMDPAILDNHPWELVCFYRGIFCYEAGFPDTASSWLRRAIDIALAEDHGPAMRLIGAVLAVAAWEQTGDDEFARIAKAVLDGESTGSKPATPIEVLLPSTAHKADALRELLSAPPDADAVDDALRVLPFNYR